MKIRITADGNKVTVERTDPITGERESATLTYAEIADVLTPREAKVLRMYLGIKMATNRTLEEVCSTATREYVRQIRHQIEEKVLRTVFPAAMALWIWLSAA